MKAVGGVAEEGADTDGPGWYWTPFMIIGGSADETEEEVVTVGEEEVATWAEEE
jgi:hypothetical protein